MIYKLSPAYVALIPRVQKWEEIKRAERGAMPLIAPTLFSF